MRPSIPSKFRALLHPQIPLTCGPHILTFSTQQVHLPSRFLTPYERYHTPTVYIIPPTSLHQPVPQNYANRIKQTLALTPPVLCPRESRSGGETCMYSYNCHFSVCFRTYLFVRALFGKMLRRWTQEGRPDSVVEVRARSEHCSSSGVRSEFFFRLAVDKSISRGFSARLTTGIRTIAYFLS